MKTVKASTFKAQCLHLMDQVATTGERIVITKRGRPVSVLVPYVDPARSLFGRHRGQIEIHGDLVSPLDVEWDADS